MLSRKNAHFERGLSCIKFVGVQSHERLLNKRGVYYTRDYTHVWLKKNGSGSSSRECVCIDIFVVLVKMIMRQGL